MEVYVYKTNIDNLELAQKLSLLFDQRKEIIQWTVDTEDCDKVLRIVSKDQTSEKLYKELVQRSGFFCDEL